MLFSYLLFFVIILFVPPSLKPVLCRKELGLASAVSSPPSGSERSPAAEHIKCFFRALLCLMAVLKTVII